MFCKQGFIEFLKTERHPKSLQDAFNQWMGGIPQFQGEAYTNLYDTYREPVEPKEDRWGGFPPLGDL